MSKELEIFSELLKELLKIDNEFPLQYAICLSHIAQNQGLSLTHLSEQTNMPLSTVSRIVGALSRKRQKGLPFNLIRVEINQNERRKKQLYLTKRGENVIQSLESILFST